jgi:CDP-diacylglycerol--glycerol-3-phosphate 3-phosphatidyltransferase
LVRAEAVAVATVVASYLLPAASGLVRFGTFTSYHTWGAKLAAGLTGITLILMCAGGPTWPFRVAAVVCAIAALEEIALTLLLREPHSNVRTLWHVLRNRR